ncbi:MAG TPA: bifunctional diguanylate cyclase/phosphodiesterase [Mycobacterium sp.]|uniref:putative bifunctional diguanylate cyclase/phosphodiesterase n=1 Tax=Mycobacterium sp. TaxID=1785 RepID=UPI002CA04114|nr:bifunctional diguanylate cyclase/phosphodiesterase [Mycobacterium sp.]HXO78492.1 bifunctional diguanylate cyclase/phosphodiesterase [Mycobacterium sp.]
MSAMTPRRTALVVLATAGWLFLAVMLFGGRGYPGVGPLGAVIMSAFATGCAVNAACAARSGQRFAWIALAAGLGGWALGNALWCYVALRGAAPISASAAAELGYVVLPLFALGATVLVPNRDDYRFGLGLLLDVILVAVSLFLVLGSLTFDAAERASIPRIVLAVITAIYLGLVVIASIVVRTAERGRRLSPALLTMGFAAVGIAGVLNLHGNRTDHIPHDGVTLGWISGMYFLALSALASRPGPDLDTTRASHAFSRLSMWLPYLPVSVAIVAFAVRFWPPDWGNALIFAAGMVLSVTVLLRQLLVLERKRRLLEAVADAALRDTVTGLANRRLLDERLAHAMQLHVRLAVPVSLLRVRVDDFNVVNETLGYAASEELLRSVGARIQASVRADDTVARMGGDEFAILVEDRPEVAAQVGKRLARAFDSALDIGANRVYVHLSIGVATAAPHDDTSVTAGDLLDHAEAARSRAEQTSATDMQTFTPEMDAHLGTRQSFRDGMARLQLLWDLRRAIDDRLLTLVYQPQFGLATGAICGAEALLRWEHITLGSLEPGEFLPLVREHGLMDAVTDLVLSRAVADASGWHAAGTAIPVAINIWARSLDEDTLPDRIMSVLDAHGMPANLLTVEITEELVVADFAKGRAVLNRLRDAGIRVSIDDFGSGYSTLTYLRELPIDEVKLDRHLIAPIPYDQRAATIARSVIELAAEFGIASVAEGIENDETVQWLRRFGCDVVQGNYFCGPLPAGEIPQVPSVPAQKV